nr:hypothetical protein CFP56_30661 [Quercus suber]
MSKLLFLRLFVLLYIPQAFPLQATKKAYLFMFSDRRRPPIVIDTGKGKAAHMSFYLFWYVDRDIELWDCQSCGTQHKLIIVIDACSGRTDVEKKTIGSAGSSCYLRLRDTTV